MGEFKLLDSECSVIYEGVMSGNRLEKEDIKVEPNTYLDLIMKSKYIIIVGNTYYFEDYLENTMTKVEGDMVVRKQIYDKEGNREFWKQWEGRMRKSKTILDEK